MTRRVLLCPLASPGFAFPLVAIARALAAGGAAPTLVLPPGLAAAVAPTGLAVDSMDPATARAFSPSAWYHPEAVAAQVGWLGAALARHRPAVLVASALALGPLFAARRAGLPVAVHGLLSDLPPTDPGQRAEVDAALAACGARLGAPPPELRGDLLLRPGLPGLVEHGLPVGACAWEPPPAPAVAAWLAARRAAGEPVLSVHPGRTFGAPSFLPLLAGALPPGWRIAASLARSDAPPPAWPPGSLVGAFVPQGAVLAQAAIAVCSGTTTPVLGALAHGVPLVTVSAGGEQAALGRLVARAGVGVDLPARAASTATLAAALQRALALDPAPRRALARRFAALDGPGRASRAILGLSCPGPEEP